jgi:hypothetical protein
VAEQLVLQDLPRERAAVQGDERPLAPGGLLVNGPGDQLLAGAALPDDEDAGIGWGHGLDDGEDLPHLLRLPDHVLVLGEALELLLELEVGGADVVLLQRLGDQGLEALQVQGLGQIVVCAVAHGLHGRVHRRLARDHDELALDAALAHPGEQLEPVQLGHLEVGQDQTVPARLELFPRLLPIGGHLGGVAVLGEDHLQSFRDVLLVVGDQDLRTGHIVGIPGFREIGRTSKVPGWRIMGQAASARGRSRVIRVPTPSGAASAVISPPASSTSRRARASPRPGARSTGARRAGPGRPCRGW